MFSRKSLIASIFCLILLTSFSASAGVTNFTGNWFGTCRSNQGQSRNTSITIYQDGPRGISLDNRNFHFGEVVETRIPTDPNQYPPSFNVAYEVVRLTNNATTMEYLYSGILRSTQTNWNAVITNRYSITNGALVMIINDLTSGFTESCHFMKY